MSSLDLRSSQRLFENWGGWAVWLDGKRSLTYCGWPACGGPAFPHHLNKLGICYSSNL